MLASAAYVLAEDGYERMSVARVTHGARVSRRTFYDVFEDREDCFLAVFEDALARLSQRVIDAYQEVEARDWCERIRSGFQELLTFFDEEPHLAKLLVVDALRTGPQVLRRRAEVLARVASAIQDGGAKASNDLEELSPLTGEGVVGGVLGVIHTRLSSENTGKLLGLLNPLMAVIVLPYLGSVAAQGELSRTDPRPVTKRHTRSHGPSGASGSSGSRSPRQDPLADLPMRLTYRTLCVLEGVAARPGASNREVADLAGITDQGQISKLLTRLEKLGLLRNMAEQGHQPTGEPNAWCLTLRGEEVQRVTGIGSVDGGREGAMQ
jgi:AcrR family transcriptional regulator